MMKAKPKKSRNKLFKKRIYKLNVIITIEMEKKNQITHPHKKS